MDIKKLLIGTLVGAVVIYAVGYVIWDLLVGDFYDANMGSATGVNRDPQLLWAVIIGTVGYAVFITLAIVTRAGSSSIADGLKVGATVGFLMWLTVDFFFLGIQNVSTPIIAVIDPLLEAVHAGIAGAAIAAVLAKL